MYGSFSMRLERTIMRGNVYKLLCLILLLIGGFAFTVTAEINVDSTADQGALHESEASDSRKSWTDLSPGVDGKPISKEQRFDDEDNLSKSEKVSNQSTQEDVTKQQQQKEGSATTHSESSKQRLWGSATGASAASHGDHAEHERNETTGQGPHGLPFVAKSKHHHVPPEGFTLAARVYVDPIDKLAHFDDSAEGVTLPYWDCGVVGSTTAPLPLKHATFRHCLVASTTTYFSSGNSPTGPDVSSSESRSDLHPVIMIPLTPVTIELNSGAHQECAAGDVILLEDALLPGHKINPIQTDALILFLTLPQSHFHTGREHLSIRSAVLKNNKRDPCPADNAANDSNPKLLDWRYERSGKQLRKFISGALGMSLFALAADFLGKVAPLWLAVGIGGTFFVASGTYFTVILGDYLWNSWEFWQEKRRLRSTANTIGLNDATPDEDPDG